MNAETIIRRHVALGRLPDKAIAELARVSTVRRLRRGDGVLRAGELIESFMVIGSGVTLTTVGIGGPRELIVSLDQPGDCPHEFPDGDGVPSTAEITVFTATAALSSTPLPALVSALEQHGAVALALAREMSRRATLALSRAGRLALSAEERLAATLLELCAHFGDEGADGQMVIPLRIFRHQFAAMVGSTDETVIRTFKRWHQQRLVLTDLTSITLLDPPALAAIAANGSVRPRAPAAIA